MHVMYSCFPREKKNFCNDNLIVARLMDSISATPARLYIIESLIKILARYINFTKQTCPYPAAFRKTYSKLSKKNVSYKNMKTLIYLK